MSAKKTDMNT